VKLNLAQTLSDLAGTDSEGRQIFAFEGYSNALKPSNSSEDCTPDSNMSPISLSFVFNRKDETCNRRDRVLLSSICPSLSKVELKRGEDGRFIDDCFVIKRYKEWRAFFTLRVARCDGIDVIDRIDLGIDCANPIAKVNAGFKNLEISDVVDISAISTGEEWQDRAQATLALTYGHTTIIKPKCVPQIRCVTSILLDRQRQTKEAKHGC